MTPATRFHLSLNVNNLDRSVAFYKVLFGREPAKLRGDYAKFEVDDPPLVLSLEPTPRPVGSPLNHVGLRLGDMAGWSRCRLAWKPAGFARSGKKGSNAAMPSRPNSG